MAFSGGKTKLMIGNLLKFNKTSHEFSGEAIVAGLSRIVIGDLEAVKEEPLYGFAGWRHNRVTVSDTEAVIGGHLHFQLIQAARKVPGNLLKDECRRQELAYMQQNSAQYVPSKERKRIKAETKERLLKDTRVSITPTDIAIDMNTGSVYVDATSNKVFDTIVSLFHQATGVEIIGFTSELPVTDMQPLALVSNKPSDPLADYKDFLTWLWFLSEEQGGKITMGAEGRIIESIVEGPLTMASQDREAKGAMFATLRNGAFPQVSSEAKAALLIGKKLQKCKLTLVREGMIWAGTFNADAFAFSALSLPEGESMTQEDRFIDTMENLKTLRDMLTTYFNAFSTANTDLRKDTLEKMDKWATDRDEY